MPCISLCLFYVINDLLDHPVDRTRPVPDRLSMDRTGPPVTGPDHHGVVRSGPHLYIIAVSLVNGKPYIIYYMTTKN
jgi:hypothetical protein